MKMPIFHRFSYQKGKPPFIPHPKQPLLGPNIEFFH